MADPSTPPPHTLRAAEPADRPFLAELYASTRKEELAPVPWPEELKRAFLQDQFDKQDQQYRANYPGASFDVVEVGGERAGRLYVHRRAAEIRIMDVAFLPKFRRLGLGTHLLRQILAEGEASGKVVSIHVEQHNPALALYQRLGFEIAGDRGVYYLLERPAPKL